MRKSEVLFGERYLLGDTPVISYNNNLSADSGKSILVS